MELECIDCQGLFERVKRPGRIPRRCSFCEQGQDFVDNAYTGSSELLLGTPDSLPKGNEAQCMVKGCGRIFTSNTAADSHRDWRCDPPCKDPASLGMTAKERRGLPIWTTHRDR